MTRTSVSLRDFQEDTNIWSAVFESNILVVGDQTHSHLWRCLSVVTPCEQRGCCGSHVFQRGRPLEEGFRRAVQARGRRWRPRCRRHVDHNTVFQVAQEMTSDRRICVSFFIFQQVVGLWRWREGTCHELNTRPGPADCSNTMCESLISDHHGRGKRSKEKVFFYFISGWNGVKCGTAPCSVLGEL